MVFTSTPGLQGDGGPPNPEVLTPGVQELHFEDHCPQLPPNTKQGPHKPSRSLFAQAAGSLQVESPLGDILIPGTQQYLLALLPLKETKALA